MGPLLSLGPIPNFIYKKIGENFGEKSGFTIKLRI